MTKKRAPFSCGLAVFRGAAAEFVAAVEVADEFGFAPTGDEFAEQAAEVFGVVSVLHTETEILKRKTLKWGRCMGRGITPWDHSTK